MDRFRCPLCQGIELCLSVLRNGVGVREQALNCHGELRMESNRFRVARISARSHRRHRQCGEDNPSKTR